MTSISKNLYIDKLDDIVSKCNNGYNNAIKMKPVDVKSSTLIKKTLKTLLGMVMFQIGVKEFL